MTLEQDTAVTDEMSLRVALDFADNPRPYHTLQAPADTNSELYRALSVLASAYRAALSSRASAEPVCSGADDPGERCPIHPRDCKCWQVDLDHPTVQKPEKRVRLTPVMAGPENEVKRLREALKFYADPVNYIDAKWEQDSDTPNAIPATCQEGAWVCDCGDIARSALVALPFVSELEGENIERVARAFQDAFTNGNATWDETPEHHKAAFREGARAALEQARTL